MRLAIPLRGSPHSLTGAYALDALDSAGRDRFERHLRDCASCRGEVRGFATAVAALADAAASVRQGKMVFTSSGLRPLPGSRVYQLWFIGKTTRPAGLVPAAAGGRTAPVVASGMAAGDKIGVTIEPAGGSSAPTTAPIVLMTLAA